MDWKELSKKHFVLECLALSAIVVCCVISIIGELCAANGRILLEILNYDSLSLVIIQIQATVQTLSIALLALASGYAADSSMGIHYNRYLFQIKPRIFQQRTIVITLIALLAINVFFHMLGWYNIVTGIFVVACIIISMSAWEIYSIFVGNTQIKAEIEAYTRYLASGSQSLDDRISALHTFCDGWKDSMEAQSNREFDQYMEAFRIFLNSLLMEQPAQARESLQAEAVSLIAAFGRSMNRNVRERGLLFLLACYTEMCGAIRNSKNLPCDGGIHILHEAYYDIVQLVRSLPVSSIEKIFAWYDFLEYVLVANLHFGYSDENEFGDIVDLSSLMGDYITGHKADDHDEKFWGRPLEDAEDMLSVPETHRQRTQELFETVKYTYAVRLIQGGMLNLLKDYFYQKALRDAFLIKTVSGGRLILKVHCYLYYLSEYETTNCILPELQADCTASLWDTDVQKLFFYALEQIGHLDDKHTRRDCTQGYLFTAKLIDQIYNTLMRDELFPQFGRGKTLMMGAAVMDFITFCGLYIYGQLYDSTILERMIPDEKALNFYHRFVRNGDVKTRFTSFLHLLVQDNCEETSKKMLMVLEKVLREKIKQHQLCDAERMQTDYDADDSRPVALYNACIRIQEHLNRTFSDFLYEGTHQEACVKIRACSANNPTDMSIEKFVDEHKSLWSRALIEGLCKTLKQLGSVRIWSGCDFEDDQRLLDYLGKECFAEFIGSEYVFRTKTYKSREQVHKRLLANTCVLEDCSQYGLLLQREGVRICIQNVRIGVHPAVMRDCSVVQKGSSYRFSPIDGIELDFTKDELKKFLHDSRKVYDILFEVSIHRNAGIIGDIFIWN